LGYSDINEVLAGCGKIEWSRRFVFRLRLSLSH
jgi:hypothetical protein